MPLRPTRCARGAEGRTSTVVLAALRHCEERSDEAIQPASRPSQACFAEPVIGPRDFARVRWLAMTNSIVLALRFLFAPRGLLKVFTNGPPEGEAERRKTRS